MPLEFDPLVDLFRSRIDLSQVTAGSPPVEKQGADDDHHEVPRVLDPVPATEALAAHIGHERDEDQVAQQPGTALQLRAPGGVVVTGLIVKVDWQAQRNYQNHLNRRWPHRPVNSQAGQDKGDRRQP